MNVHTWWRALVLSCVVLALGVSSAHADGFRNIASVMVDTYFDQTWRVETMDVFLARLLPALTAQARVTRDDTNGGWFQHTFFLGPVVSFTDSLYLGAGYGLAIDSAGQVTHEAEADFNYETDTTSTAVGIRSNVFPGTGYWYVLPSISARFHLARALSLFGKFFLSVDNASVVTESFWGEAEYAISSLLAARAGVTVSRASGFGYSVIAGMNFSFSRAITLKYSFQYLSATVEYLAAAPQQKDGVSNAIILDVEF